MAQGSGTSSIVKPHYDRSALSYAGSFDSPWQRGVIRSIEMMTGKIKIGRLVRKFEQQGAPRGQEVFTRVLETMGIDLQTPAEELANIPKTGPVILVANHPHGLVDGIVFAELVGRVRPDYRILTRSLLTGLDEEATNYLIPVPFPHQPDAQEQMVEMRKKAMKYLSEDGLIALFPSGVVASSDTMFGPAIEAPWNAFTAKMIRKSGATVVPMHFLGSNSRAYQIANQVSATLRQGLLIHEIARAVNKPMAPVVGKPFSCEEIDARIGDTRSFMAWLRQETLSLSR
ncbi:lysophospholipid acyltransferase family protein [Loktanella sp. F6476L]|uniref:lysophospholipid acyltransferase family protein n=1 Tax=Loktanella sp. F6476L TaxID=2926405 RepID=UPI001FF6448F|nr:lysophospholipid acyltransferase family protein [Loktanella sp. F6476L]MCK0121976.1 lysophospholipid acyltransferase family protein [Loktanella sp. F6476L]